jgi:hypothetical protein
MSLPLPARADDDAVMSHGRGECVPVGPPTSAPPRWHTWPSSRPLTLEHVALSLPLRSGPNQLLLDPASSDLDCGTCRPKSRFPWFSQASHKCFVLYAVRVVSKESRRLVLPRTSCSLRHVVREKRFVTYSKYCLDQRTPDFLISQFTRNSNLGFAPYFGALVARTEGIKDPWRNVNLLTCDILIVKRLMLGQAVA